MDADRTSTGRRAALALALSALALSGCGNQLSHAQLLADAGGSGAGSTNQVGGGLSSGQQHGPATTGGSGPAGATGATSTTGPTGAASTGSAPGSSVGTTGAAIGSGAQSSGTTGAVTTGGSTASSGQACTGRKDTIVIGTVGQQTGVLGAAFVNGTKAVNAWVASVNAAGGLGCHPVKYIVADDGGDPSRHLSLVRQLVEQDHVIAMVYQDALLTGQASEKYVTSKGIPVIGQEGGELQTYNSPVYFNHATSGTALIDWTLVAGAKAALPEGKKVLGTLTCQEVSYCNTADSRWAALAGPLGFKASYRAKASLVNVDFTSQCLGARNAGVTALAVAFDSTGIHRIAQSCASVGYHPLIICTSVQSNLDFADDPNLKGTVIAQPVLPWFLTKKPAIQTFQSTLTKYAAGVPYDTASINGWGAAQLFSLAQSAFAADTVTSAGIIASLAKVKNNDLNGLTYPLTFNAGKPQAKAICGWVVRTGTKTFTSDGIRSCR